jgi:hypothetical protein
VTGPNSQIFQIKFALYGKVIKIENELEKLDSFEQYDVLLTVQSTAHHNIHYALCTALI